MRSAVLALILASVLLNAVAQIVLRKGMLAMGALPPVGAPVRLALALASNVWLVAGLGCYVVSFGIWLAVLARTPVSVAFPMLSIGYVVTAVLGVTMLGEQVSPTRWAAIGLICLGVLLMSRAGPSAPEAARPADAASTGRTRV